MVTPGKKWPQLNKLWASRAGRTACSTYFSCNDAAGRMDNLSVQSQSSGQQQPLAAVAAAVAAKEEKPKRAAAARTKPIVLSDSEGDSEAEEASSEPE